jgi:hypothetical protein
MPAKTTLKTVSAGATPALPTCRMPRKNTSPCQGEGPGATPGKVAFVDKVLARSVR